MAGEQIPSIGRIVHFYGDKALGARKGRRGPFAAIITEVVDLHAGVVAMLVLPPQAPMFAVEAAPMEESLLPFERDELAYWEWPPRV